MDVQKEVIAVETIRDDHELLTRTDERLVALVAQVKEMRRNLNGDIDELREESVTRAEFWPVRTIVYAGAGLILSGVLGGLITLALRVQ